MWERDVGSCALRMLCLMVVMESDQTICDWARLQTSKVASHVHGLILFNIRSRCYADARHAALFQHGRTVFVPLVRAWHCHGSSGMLEPSGIVTFRYSSRGSTWLFRLLYELCHSTVQGFQARCEGYYRSHDLEQ